MFSNLKRIINEYNAGREYKKFIPRIHEATQNLNADQLVDFVNSDEWKRFFWMIQIPSEIKFLLNKVAAMKPSVVVEIGTRMGGTLFLFTKAADVNAEIVSIDFPDGHGGGYSRSRADFYRSYAVSPQRVSLIKGDSHALSTKASLESILAGKKIDFLFIDGDHSYEGVKMDFDMYSPLVRSGGLVGFHDNKPTVENSWSGVVPYWEEIKNKYTSEEYLGAEDNWGGMGIVRMP